LYKAACSAREQLSELRRCHGWVRTDMGGAGAPRSLEEGADTIAWLATEAPQNLTGKFLRDREEISW